MARKRSKSKVDAHSKPAGLLTNGGWLLTLVVTAVAPLAAGRFDFPPQAVLSAAVVMAVVLAFATGRLRQGVAAPVCLLAALALWTAVSWVGSVYRHATELELARLLVLAAVAWLVADLSTDRRGREWWLLALCAGGLVSAWVGIGQYLATPDRQWRTFGTFYNPNELATCLALSALCAAALAFASDRSLVRVFALTTGVSCLAGLALTGSRGGAAALVLGMLVFAALAGRSLWRTLSPSTRWASLGLLVVVVAVSAKPLTTRVLGARNIRHSQNFRVRTWVGTAHMAAARPVLGFGGGTFEWGYPKFAEVGFTRTAHNIYLQFAAEQGVPGLLLFLGALGLALFRRQPESADPLLVAGAKAALVAAAAHGLVDYGWQIPALAFWIAGLIGALSAPTLSSDRAPRTPSRAVLPVAAVGLLVVVMLWLVLPEWIAHRRLARAKQALVNGSLGGASEHYARAVRWSPRNEDLRLDYAGVLEALARRTDYGAEEALREAESQYRAAVSLAPSHASGLRRLGQFYFEQGRVDQALIWFRRSAEAFPNYTKAQYALGETYRELKRPEEAEAAYRRVLEIADGPAGQLQAVPELAFDPAVANAALRLAETARSRRQWEAEGTAARRGLQEMEVFRRSQSQFHLLERAGAGTAPLSDVEADVLQAELYAHAASGAWHRRRLTEFRTLVAELETLDAGGLTVLWSLVPAEAAADLEE